MARDQGPHIPKISAALLIAVSALWLIACLWFPLTDTDIWWHLASAKLMWAAKSFLRQDPFCVSSLGAPWADLHWGFQCLAYLAWKLGGAPALVAGKCLALAGALGFVLKPHLDRRTLPWLIPLAAFGIYHVRFFIDVRPLALTLLGLGIQYAAVTAYLRGRRLHPAWILVPVQIAMVNIQGLYPLGALLVSILVLGEHAGRRLPSVFASVAGSDPEHRSDSMGAAGSGSWPQGVSMPLRPLVLACGAMWLAGFASPYGMQGFKLPASLLGRIAPVASNIFSSEIAENLPFSDLLRHDPRAALPFLFLALAVAYTFDRARSRISLGHAMLFLAFAALGGMAQRNLPLSFLGGLMAAGRNLQVSLAGIGPAAEKGGTRTASSRFTDYLGRLRPFAGWAALAAIALLYGPKVRGAWEYELPGSLETPFRFPAPAVDYLERHPLPGNVFNELRYGGYLEFRLYPGKLAFVDGRMILRSAGFYRDFLSGVDHPERFDAYRRSYAITHALLPISEDQRFLPLAAHLLGRERWSLLYCDGASALLADTSMAEVATSAGAGMSLDSLPPGHPLPEALHKRFGSNPRLESMAVLNAVRFLRSAGRERAAADLLANRRAASR